jgi:hypothetical protein
MRISDPDAKFESEIRSDVQDEKCKKLLSSDAQKAKAPPRFGTAAPCDPERSGDPSGFHNSTRIPRWFGCSPVAPDFP